MERSSVCLLPVWEEDATDSARKDCLEEALELALERGFLLPTEVVLLREERASGEERRGRRWDHWWLKGLWKVPGLTNNAQKRYNCDTWLHADTTVSEERHESNHKYYYIHNLLETQTHNFTSWGWSCRSHFNFKCFRLNGSGSTSRWYTTPVEQMTALQVTHHILYMSV